MFIIKFPYILSADQNPSFLKDHFYSMWGLSYLIENNLQYFFQVTFNHLFINKIILLEINYQYIYIEISLNRGHQVQPIQGRVKLGEMPFLS